MTETTTRVSESSEKEEAPCCMEKDPPPPWISTDVKDVRAHWKCIRAVLNYWFVNDKCGDIPTLQKKLWMISQQNVTLRNSVDKDIFEQFGSLACHLGGVDTTHPDKFLDSNPPCHCPSLLWNQWCVEDSDLYGWEGKLAAIVVLDQFSRHIHRYMQNVPENECASSLLQSVRHHLPDQSVLDQLAYDTTNLLLEHHFQEFHSAAMISLPMRIFALMPLRHQSTLSTIQNTQHMIESVLSPQQEQYASMIQSFRKATNRRLAVLQDEARRAGASKISRHGDSAIENGDQTDSKSDPTVETFTDDDILECGYFVPDDPVTAPAGHIVHETIRRFLKHLDVGPSNSATSTELLTCHDATRLSVSSETSPRPVIVSLSGGVDSMVICAVLSHLQRFCRGYEHLRIVAVHIDYANRPESLAEALYVQKYCQECLGNVDYYCRRIDEVTRGVTARDDYERIAREIRYQFYRDTMKMYGSNDGASDALPVSSRGRMINAALMTSAIGVMLGHHRGDLRENVLSNAHKGCGPLDLSGMTSASYNDGVVLLRPLLPLEKTAIFDYAHAFGVPYFKDTTPHWSTRGKLRNKLLPLLEEIYGEGSMNNLSNLAVESDACRNLLHSILMQPFLDQITYKPMGIYFPTAPWKDQGLYFWKLVLRETLHSAGLGMFTDKSVESFVKRVCETIREGWLQCRKDCGVFLRDDGYVFVFYPESFPWGNAATVKSRVLDWTKSLVPFARGEEVSAQIGPWKVSTMICQSLSAEEARSNLERKPFKSMEAFMEGSFEYWLDVAVIHNPDEPSLSVPLLCFTTFVKRTRPQAWKGIDPKIQDSIPLLGPIADQQLEEHNPRWLTEKCLATVCSSSSDTDVSEARGYVRVTMFLQISADKP
jgi:tRNA(Ile)-lysidine synthetase-like protein